MGKYIKLTDEFMEQARRDFEAALKMARLSDGKFSFTKSFSKPGCDKAKVYFTPVAWVKMLTLLGNFDKEVAWHGTASRYGAEENNEYMISDILVYPQEVTGATVNTDQEQYQMWLMQQPDEVFNNIRMQGHSHVNMSTSPSSVDLEHQARILEQLDDDMFYIFMIYNKRLEFFVKIFDLKKNTVFDKSEITVSIKDETEDFAEFLKDAKAKVKDKVYQSAAAGPYQYGQGSAGYQSGGSGYGVPSVAKTPYQAPARPLVVAQPAQKPAAETPEKDKSVKKLDDSYQYNRALRGFYDYDDYYNGFYR